MSAVLPLWLSKTSVTRSPAYFPLMPGQRQLRTFFPGPRADIDSDVSKLKLEGICPASMDPRDAALVKKNRRPHVTV